MQDSNAAAFRAVAHVACYLLLVGTWKGLRGRDPAVAEAATEN